MLFELQVLFVHYLGEMLLGKLMKQAFVKTITGGKADLIINTHFISPYH